MALPRAPAHQTPMCRRLAASFGRVMANVRWPCAVGRLASPATFQRRLLESIRPYYSWTRPPSLPPSATVSTVQYRSLVQRTLRARRRPVARRRRTPGRRRRYRRRQASRRAREDTGTRFASDTRARTRACFCFSCFEALQLLQPTKERPAAPDWLRACFVSACACTSKRAEHRLRACDCAAVSCPRRGPPASYSRLRLHLSSRPRSFTSTSRGTFPCLPRPTDRLSAHRHSALSVVSLTGACIIPFQRYR